MKVYLVKVYLKVVSQSPCIELWTTFLTRGREKRKDITDRSHRDALYCYEWSRDCLIFQV